MKNEKQGPVISNEISVINTQNFKLRNMYVPKKQCNCSKYQVDKSVP